MTPDQAKDFLQTILKQKIERLESAKQSTDFDELCDQASKVRQQARAHSFRQALLSDSYNVIAEFKRRSPSKGIIRAGAEAAEVAKRYESAGAVALSVLTEQDYFDGSIDDLKSVKVATRLPVLRKDFIVDRFQIYEAATVGADAVLLIVAALDDHLLSQFRKLAEEELGLDALVEVHNDDEMRRALGVGATLIGVNNRNLRTFEVSIDVSKSLASYATSDVLLVSESGLKTRENLRELRALGYSGFLIGESLMRAVNPGEALKAFIG